MLRTFQRYKSTILGTTMVIILSVSMLNFGVNYFQKSRERYAIKVHDVTISLDEFYRERNMLEERYRSMLGENYARMADSLSLQISQSTAEQLITDALLGELAKRFGLAVSPQQIADTVRSYLGGNNFSKELYANFLGRMRLTARQFEAKVRTSLIQQQLATLLYDTVHPADIEVRSLIERDLTQYKVQYATFAPSTYTTSVAALSDEKLNELYSRWSGDFEAPAKVSYDYLILENSQFPGLVEVAPEEVELFYSENLDSFKSPDLATIDLIKLAPRTGETTNDPMPQLRSTAEEILAKLKGGESFAALAKKYSSDRTSKEKGGRIEKATQESLPEEIRTAVFSAKEPFEPLSIEGNKALYVLKVVALTPGTTKKLEEVRGDIEKKLINQVAPSFLNAKAQELLTEWQKSGQSLQEFATARKLPIRSAQQLSVGQPPAPESDLATLTDKIIAAPGDMRRVVDLTSTSALIEIKEMKEPELRPLAEVKEAIISRYTSEEAEALARQAANEFLQQLQTAPEKLAQFAALATSAKASVAEADNISRKAPGQSILARQDFLNEILSQNTASRAPKRVIASNGEFYVLHILEVRPPRAEEIESNKASYQKQAASEAADDILRSILSREKYLAKPDIDAYILSQQ